MNRIMFQRALILGSLLMLFVASVPDRAEARSVYKRGETVRFEGQITGSNGLPLAGLTVALEASQKGYRLRGLSLKGLKREKRDALQVFTRTDEDGRYVINWDWNPYYNVFELLAAMPVETSSSPKLDILERIDVTSRVEESNPVVTSMTVEAGAFVNWLQRFTSGQASEDEVRVYQELGRPDRFDVATEAGETSWWYFELGKVYRFQEGGLEQITHFEPVKDVVVP